MQTASSFVGLVVLALVVAGCEKPSSPPPAAPHTHAPGDGHDHADGHDHGDGHGHGPETKLGEQSVDGLTIAAVREGEAKPGAEASFDVVVKGDGVKVVAVRMWIGAQDAKGAMKAKADAEGDGWHAHVEVPASLAAESKLWVEVETDKGARSLAGFGL